MDVQSHVLLTSALVGGEWSASRHGLYISGKAEWATEPDWTTWRGEKPYPFWDSNFDPSAGRYTDCATLALEVLG
jgi:hypothetical protein